jgi:serine/threonine protein kinase
MSDPTDKPTVPQTGSENPPVPSGQYETLATRAITSSQDALQPAESTSSVPETVGGSQCSQPANRPIQVAGYQVLEELGRGGMGVVYKARQIGLNRLVALKMILSGDHASRDDLERFRAEAEVIARLQHPNIVQVYEINDHEGRPFFSMEYVDGGSLAERIRDQPQPPREAASLLRMLASAVHAAHQAGIVHRDLKPANILLACGGREPPVAAETGGSRPLLALPKITDFGLAKRLEAGKGKTRSGDILGTPNYMAPEQALGRISLIGPATDIYALGAILYELLTGRPPFGKESLLETLEQVRAEEPVAPSRYSAQLPRDLEIICLKCLRKQPKDRYGSAEELADDLGRFLAGEPILARPISTRERLVLWIKRHPLRTASALAVLVLAGLVATAVILWPRGEKPPEKTAPEEQFTEAQIRKAAVQPRRDLFLRLFRGRTADGWVLNDLADVANEGHESWSHAQAVCALLRCPAATDKELKELIPSLELMRTKFQRMERDGVKYGWPPRDGTTFTQPEPMLWAAGALAVALGRPGYLTGQTRKDLEDFLHETHAILRTYAPPADDHNRGWKIVPNPRQAAVQNTYVNILALQVLLETRQAGLAWDGSIKRRDALIAQTARWLVHTFDPKGEPPGWYKDNASKDVIVGGLTLQAHAVLLRAAVEANFPLRKDMGERARKAVLRYRHRTMKFPNEGVWTSYPFRAPDGANAELKFPLTFLWYPWAVEASIRWLEYGRKIGAQQDKLDEVQNLLGRLVVQLGPEAPTEGTSFVFVSAERLYAFSSVPVP